MNYVSSMLTMAFDSDVFMSVVDVTLRIPPLFVIDELLKYSSTILGFDNHQALEFPTNVSPASGNYTIQLSGDKLKTLFYEMLVGALFKSIALAVAILIALCIFLLRRRHLLVIYVYLLSIATIFLSYWLNCQCMSKLAQTHWTIWRYAHNLDHPKVAFTFNMFTNMSDQMQIFVLNAITQGSLASVFTAITLMPRRRATDAIVVASFMLPSVVQLLYPFVPTHVIEHSVTLGPLLALAVAKFVIWYNFFTLTQVFVSGYVKIRTYMTEYDRGLPQLIYAEWERLNVPCVLRWFWYMRAIENTVIFILIKQYPTVMDSDVIMDIGKNVLITGCETLLAVLGMTSVVSLVCHYIGSLFVWFLVTHHDDHAICHLAAILFYVLALQTGLTSLEPDKRFVRLGRNFCLLITALLHFIHNMVSPIMMSLSALLVQSRSRHVRALTVCAFLIWFPITLLYYLWSNYVITTWLLAVTAFGIEVIVKVSVTLASYSLFMIDALYPNVMADKCDDYNYYLKAFGNSVEFLFGIFLFFNGAWILFFESGGAIRAIMMCIHAYFNIWREARTGWAGFMRRRTAVSKIGSLAEATREQLNRLNDVCAICYSKMTTAKITMCNHYFHSSCLRRWLYVQDRCPLCHNTVYRSSNAWGNQFDAPAD